MRSVFRIPRRRGTSAAGSRPPMSTRCSGRSMRHGGACGHSSRRRFSRRRCSTWTARWCRRRASARRGWTSRTRARGGFIRCSSRWRTRRSPCSSRTAAGADRRTRMRPHASIRRRSGAARRAFSACGCAAIRTSRRRSTWIAGAKRGWSSSSASTRCRIWWHWLRSWNLACGSAWIAHPSTSASEPSVRGPRRSRSRSSASAASRTCDCSRRT